jgi:hypothetical protein
MDPLSYSDYSEDIDSSDADSDGSDAGSDAELSILSLDLDSSDDGGGSSHARSVSSPLFQGGDGGSDSAELVDAAADMLDLERQLEASIFQVEPVTHITYQLLYVDGNRALERVERHVMRLRVPNVIDRFDVARIIKAARYDRTATRQLYRLEALFVYNMDLAFGELRSLLTSPAFPVARFITVLSTLSNFTLRPTMACFHSTNSIHAVLARTPLPRVSAAPLTAPLMKRRIVITPAASTRRKPPKCHRY